MHASRWQDVAAIGSCSASDGDEACPARRVIEINMGGRGGSVLRLCRRHLDELAKLRNKR